jgi:hypothetical protein
MSGKYRSFATRVSQLKICYFSGETFKEIYILLTAHLDVILVNDQLDAHFLTVFISCIYMFRATSAHHQEDQFVSIHLDRHVRHTHQSVLYQMMY